MTKPNPLGGRPQLSKRGPARSLTVRLTPEEWDKIARIQKRLGGATATEAIRWALRRAR